MPDLFFQSIYGEDLGTVSMDHVPAVGAFLLNPAGDDRDFTVTRVLYRMEGGNGLGVVVQVTEFQGDLKR